MSFAANSRPSTTPCLSGDASYLKTICSSSASIIAALLLRQYVVFGAIDKGTIPLNGRTFFHSVSACVMRPALRPSRIEPGAFSVLDSLRLRDKRPSASMTEWVEKKKWVGIASSVSESVHSGVRYETLGCDCCCIHQRLGRRYHCQRLCEDA